MANPSGKNITAITPDEARALYFGFGAARTLVKLENALREKFGRDAPSQRTLQVWCSRDKWVAAAADYDARVATRTLDTVEDQAVERNVDLLSEVQLLGSDAIAWLRAGLQTVKPADTYQMTAMTAKVIEIMQAVEVATGGVSSRTEHRAVSELELSDMLGGFGVVEEIRPKGDEATH